MNLNTRKATYEWILSGNEPIIAGYLYFSGGKDSLDRGCPYWGIEKSNEIMLIGDCAGEILIEYDNKIIDSIPLIYGYTIWWDKAWSQDFKEPFTNESIASKLMQETLFLKNAYDGTFPYLMKIKLRDIPIKNIKYYSNPLKNGIWLEPKLKFDFILSGNEELCKVASEFDISGDELFFDFHTILSSNPYPSYIQSNLEQIRKILYTFESDIEQAKPFDIPKDYNGTTVIFTGEPEANIISNVFHYNLIDQINRVLPNGFISESGAGAILYNHCGIGTWAYNIGAYAEHFYTRNNGVCLLSDLNYLELCNKVLNYLDEAMMFFPRNYPSLQLCGQIIPGHLTVVAQDPLFYSNYLPPNGSWAPNYTYEKFGDHFKDFGNPETDGHGYSMISHWKTWVKSGRQNNWVLERWQYIKEAAEYIKWHLDNPERSFSQFGLLYAESEAGMQDFTLHCNIPCYIGLLMYSEMAQSIGEILYAESWKKQADSLEEAIDNYFTLIDDNFGEIWNVTSLWPTKVSTVLTFFHKYFGCDLTDKLPKNWLQRSMNTYLKDKQAKSNFFAPEGLGYDHNMYTQDALLLDMMADSTKWIKNLARMCYSPRLPNPYIVPEGSAIDIENGIYRRAGDLGNGIQQQETLISILLCCGIDDSNPNELIIMPRLPQNFNLKLSKYPVSSMFDGKMSISELDLIVTYPTISSQEVQIKVVSGSPIYNVKLRVGPFNLQQKEINVSINGNNLLILDCFQSGDSKWAWVDINKI